MSTFTRCACPPPAGPNIRIERLAANQKMFVAVLGDQIEWFLTHWMPRSGKRKGYSLPCLTPHEQCRGHQLQLPSKWRGYLHVKEMTNGKVCFVEVTQGMGEDLKKVVPDALSYRGMCLNIWRLNGDQARLKCDIQAHWEARSKDPLPPTYSVEKILKKLWDYNEKGDDGESCLPL